MVIGLGAACRQETDGPDRAAWRARQYHRRHRWCCITPRKPKQNGFVDSYNERMRAALLNETMFRDRSHARAVIPVWAACYKKARPHSAPGNLTRRAFAGCLFAAAGSHATLSDWLGW